MSDLRRERPRLLAPVVTALLLRLAFLPVAAALPHLGDAQAYLFCVREFAETGRFGFLKEGVRPPLHRVIAAPGLGADGDPFPGVLLIQIAIDVAACALIGLVGTRAFGARAGRFGAFLYALMPQAIFLSAGVIMVEPLAAVGSAAALLALMALVPPPASRARRLGLGAGLGLALGAGLLSKELALSAAVVVIAVLIGRPWRARLPAAVCAVAVAAACVTPWLLHNLRVHRAPIFSGTYAHYSLVVDNAPPGQDGLQLWRDAHGMRAKTELARATFADALWRYPRVTFERALARLRIALGPDVMLPTWIALTFDDFAAPDSSNLALFRHAWTLPAGGWGRRFQLACSVATLLLFALAAAGLALADPGPLRRAAIFATVLLAVSMMLTVAAGRYRLTLLPFLAPFAGLALARLGRRDGDPEREAIAGTWAAVTAAVLVTTLFVLGPP